MNGEALRPLIPCRCSGQHRRSFRFRTRSTHKPCDGFVPVGINSLDSQVHNKDWGTVTCAEICILDVCEFKLGIDVCASEIRLYPQVSTNMSSVRDDLDLALSNSVGFTIMCLIVLCLAIPEHSNHTRERIWVT